MTTYYHFCHIALDNWTADNRYHTPEDKQNLYWQKVFARASYEHSLARAASEAFVGVQPTCVPAESHAETRAAKEYLLTCFRELLFEMARQKTRRSFPRAAAASFSWNATPILRRARNATASEMLDGRWSRSRRWVEVESSRHTRRCWTRPSSPRTSSAPRGSIGRELRLKRRRMKWKSFSLARFGFEASAGGRCTLADD